MKHHAVALQGDLPDRAIAKITSRLDVAIREPMAIAAVVPHQRRQAVPCELPAVLLAAQQWIGGVVLTVIGAAIAVPAVKAFHGLSRRWLVFVPAGVTLIDHIGLVDPVLFPARQISAFGPAVEATTATDLTQQALGLVLEISFDSPVEVMARTSKVEGELQLLKAVLISPTRPGAVVAEADRRGLRTPVNA